MSGDVKVTTGDLLGISSPSMMASNVAAANNNTNGVPSSTSIKTDLERRSELLREARRQQSSFVVSAGDESPAVSTDNQRKSINNHGENGEVEAETGMNSRTGTDPTTALSSSSSLDQPQEGFAFPVTKQIITFLNKFSKNPSITGVVPAPSDSPTPASTGPETLESSARGPPSLPSQHTKKTKAKLAYHTFLDKLKQPGAADVVKSIKGFVINFKAGRLPGLEARSIDSDSNDDDDEDWSASNMPGSGNPMSAIVRNFLNTTIARLRAHDLWRGCDEIEWQNTVEGLEKFLMGKVYSKAFAPTASDKRRDKDIERKIATLAFIQPKHLDIRNVDRGDYEDDWELAAGELRKVNSYRAPRDKVVCILNCCRVVTKLLTKAAGSVGSLPGADEFLPALIYTVLRANPENLHSNIEYIASFRNPSCLTSEPGYFFTHLTSAVAFLGQMDESMLSIDADEFRAGIAKSALAWEAKQQQQLITDAEKQETAAKASENVAQGTSNRVSAAAIMPRKAASGYPAKENSVPTHVTPSIAEARSASVPEPGEMSQWRGKHGRFAGVSYGELLASEVPELLAEYKHVLAVCEQLLQERAKGSGKRSNIWDKL